MFKNLGSKRKLWTIGLTAALVVASSGIAYAYWSSQGTNTVGGGGTAAEATTLVVTTGTQVGTLEPGGAPVAVPFTVHNPGTTDLKLMNTITVDFKTAGVAWVPPTNCLAADYHAIGKLAGDIAQTITAGGDVQGTVTLSLEATAVDQNGCKGQSVPLEITVK